MNKHVVVLSSYVLLKYLAHISKPKRDMEVTLKDNHLKVDEIGDGVEFESLEKDVDYSCAHSSHSILQLRSILSSMPEQPITLAFDGWIEIKNITL